MAGESNFKVFGRATRSNTLLSITGVTEIKKTNQPSNSEFRSLGKISEYSRLRAIEERSNEAMTSKYPCKLFLERMPNNL
jgi:hypothetical protein